MHRTTPLIALVALAPLAVGQAAKAPQATEAASKLALVEPSSTTEIGHRVAILDGNADRILTEEQGPDDLVARKYWARIRDARTNQALDLRQHADRILGALSRDGRRAVVASGTRVEVYDAANGKLLAQRDFPGNVRCLDVTRTGETIAACVGADTHVWIVQGGEVEKATTHQGAANAARIEPGGRLLFTAGDDGVIRGYDLTTRKVAGTLQPAQPRPITALEICANGRRGSAVAGTLILIWDPVGLTFQGEIESSQPVSAVALREDGEELVAASGRSLRTYSTATRKALAELGEVGELRGRVVTAGTSTLAAIQNPAAAHGTWIRGWLAWKATAGGGR